MADRYWVGGTGSWSSTNTVNWSASSGGGTGASVPTAADNVFFDANSNVGTGAFTVTMANTPRVCNDITISGLDGTMTLAGSSIGLTVSGSLSFPATNFTRTYTGTTTFNATTTGKTITTNGVAFGGAVTLDGVGGAWTLGSAFSCGTGTLTLTNGTFDTSVSNYAVTVGTFSSSNSNTRTINLNGSTVTLSGSWTMTTSTNATLNAGTSTINGSNTNFNFSGGGKTFYNVAFTSASLNSPSISGANTFNNLSITGRTTVGIGVLSIANQTINGTFTVSAGTASAFRIQVSSGTTSTLTCAAVSLTDADFKNITIAGAASPATGTRLGDCKGNSGITFDAAKTVFYRQTGSANWGATGSGSWSATSGGALDATQFPLAQDTAVFPAATYPASGSTATINANYNIGTIDMSLRTTNTMTLTTGFTNPFIYGNWINGTGITISGTGTLTFAGRTTQQITSAGRSFVQSITLQSPSGTLQLLDAATTTAGFSHLFGTLNLNGYSFSMSGFGMSNTIGPADINASTTGSSIFLTSATASWTANGTGTLTGVLPVYLSSTSSTANRRDIRNTTYVNTANVNNRVDFYITGGSGLATVTFGVSGGTQGSIDFTGFSGTCNLGTTTGGFSCFINCNGNFILSTGMSVGPYGTNGNLFLNGFVGGGTPAVITTNAKTIPRNVNFGLVANTSGVRELSDNFTVDPAASATLSYGTLDLNGQTFTVGTTFATGAGTKNLTFNGGTLVCPAASTTAFNNSNSLGFTTTAGTGTGTISMTAATAKTFVGGGSTYNCTLNQGGAGTLTITGANTFNDITNTNATASQITFPASTTTTVNAFTLSGTSGNLVSIRSSTPATQFTLSKSSGTVSVSFLNIQDSNATGGATWEAFTTNGNVNSGNNLGWDFGASIYLAAISELATASDSIVSRLTAVGATNETSTASDSIATVLRRVGSISETSTAGDVIASILTAVGAVSETSTASDSIASVLTAIGAVSETSTISEATNSTLVGVGNIAETSTVADSSVGNVVAPAALLESATISDANSSILTAVGAVSESSTLTDATTSSLVAVGQTSESATGSDAISSNAVFPNALSESATASDSIVGNATLLVSSAESSTVSDSPQSVLTRVGSVSESAVVSDQASSQLTAVGAVSEQVSGADATAASFVLVGNIREGFFFYQNTGSLPTGTAFTGSPVFSNTSAGGGLTVVANGTGTGSAGGFNAGKNYVLFTGANTRSIRTVSLNLVDCQSISFSLIRGNSSNGGETPDTNENIVVEYSINGGASYSTITTITNTAAPTTFTVLSFSLPLAAQTSATIIRWRQAASSAGVFDNYGIRDFYFGASGVIASDTVARSLIRLGAVSETSTAVDSIVASLRRVGLINETSTASDAVVTVLRRIGLISETSTASDSIAAGLQRVGAVSETNTVSDSAAAGLQRLGAVSESSTVSDSVASFVTFLCTLIEQAQVSESVSAQLTAVGAVLEQARGADQVLGGLSILAQTAEGAAILDQALIRFYWELIEDNQLPNWQNASNTQTPSWTEINTSTTPSWQNISNNQASSWTTIDTAADGNWNNINTLPE